MHADYVARQAHLLDAMLADPDNLDIAFEYALVSAHLGDHEAAISTLERMLIFAPGLPRVQLELGVLYFRLGSTAVARSYFSDVLTAADVSAEVVDKVEIYLAAIDEAEKPFDVTASLAVGARGQTNANAAPGGRRISLNGTDFLLDETATGQADVNGFIAGTLHGAYDLGAQGDLLEADLLFYGARYATEQQLNSELAELTVGPSFNLERFAIDDARLGVYAIVSGIRLDGANYSGGLGGGVRLALQPQPSTAVAVTAEVSRRWFNDTSTYPTISDRNGYFARGSVKFIHRLTGACSARLLLLSDYEEARVEREESWEAGFGLGGTYRFASPLNVANVAPWTFDVEAGYLRRQYLSPDPIVNASESERDNEFWLRGVLSVPVKPDLVMAVSSEFRRLQSNYDTRDYSNASAMISLVKSF